MGLCGILEGRGKYEMKALSFDSELQIKISTNGLDDAVDYSVAQSPTPIRVRFLPWFDPVGSHCTPMRESGNRAGEGSANAPPLPAADALPRHYVLLWARAGRNGGAQHASHPHAVHPHAEPRSEGTLSTLITHSATTSSRPTRWSSASRSAS